MITIEQLNRRISSLQKELDDMLTLRRILCEYLLPDDSGESAITANLTQAQAAERFGEEPPGNTGQSTEETGTSELILLAFREAPKHPTVPELLASIDKASGFSWHMKSPEEKSLIMGRIARRIKKWVDSGKIRVVNKGPFSRLSRLELVEPEPVEKKKRGARKSRRPKVQ